MPVDVALLGCSHLPHAISYARAVVSGVAGRLVAVYDESPELGLPTAATLGVPYHEDPLELFRTHAPRAVIVCSATVDHRALVELAAANGSDVLCEKPLATTVDDAAAMVSACTAAGVQLHTAFVSRFYPVLQEIRDIVRAGGLGTVRGMVGGNRGTPPVAPKYPAWITDPEKSGGGALIDHSVHVLDAMRFISGLEVRSVMAEIDSLFWDLAVEDSALVSMVFDSDAVGSIDPSWSVGATNPWEYDFYLRIVGTEGSLAVASGRESLQMSGVHDGRSFRQVPFEPDINRSMINAFLASIESGTVLDPCAIGTDGLRAAEVVAAAYKSVAQRGLVAIGGPSD